MLKKCFWITTTLILLLTTQVFAVEIFPLEQIKPGMVGKGRTVVRGTNIEEFSVEIIDIIPQQPPTPSLIMIRVSGDVIERSGGIASGMSGSPIYIGEKLLGAIGYGYALTDHKVGLVTPAKDMLELYEKIPQDNEEVNLSQDIAPLKTPLAVTGISGRALEYLEIQFADYQVEVVSGVAGSNEMPTDISLEPGSAFGVQLMRGDFQAVAFGTVTHVENDNFVGFGHPFLHLGDVNYFVTPANIHYTIANLEFPFKVASAGQTIGTLYQDRAAGIAGLIDREPDYIPVNIEVLDESNGVSRSYQVETVSDESLLRSLAVSSVYQGIDSTLDRVGRGSANVRIEFKSSDFATRVIRENMFYSESDIAIWSLYDLIEGLELLLLNRFQEVSLDEVDITVIIEAARKTANIEKALPKQFQVVAGESVEVEVAIRPFRDVIESRILRIDIPEDTLPGLLTVTVRGGGASYYASKPSVHLGLPDPEKEEEEERRDLPTAGESLDKLIEEFVDRERNNELVAEFYPFIDSYSAHVEDTPEPDSEFEGEPVDPEITESEMYNFHWDDTVNEPIRVRLTTQFVIDGMATFDLEVLPAEE